MTSDSTADASVRLLAAAESGDVAAAARALDDGAPIEARDHKDRTALLLATTFDHVDVARLLVERGADPARSPPLVDTDHGTAQVSDPFGNSLGLIGIDSSNARRARHQRTAQKLALQNVRETLDQMQHKESEQKRINRVIGWAAVVVVLLAMAFAWTLASQQQRNAAALPALPIKAPGP